MPSGQFYVRDLLKLLRATRERLHSSFNNLCALLSSDHNLVALEVGKCKALALVGDLRAPGALVEVGLYTAGGSFYISGTSTLGEVNLKLNNCLKLRRNNDSHATLTLRSVRAICLYGITCLLTPFPMPST